MAATARRTRVINPRIDEARRALIDRAAAALGKDLTLDAPPAENPRLRKLMAQRS